MFTSRIWRYSCDQLGSNIQKRQHTWRLQLPPKCCQTTQCCNIQLHLPICFPTQFRSSGPLYNRIGCIIYKEFPTLRNQKLIKTITQSNQIFLSCFAKIILILSSLLYQYHPSNPIPSGFLTTILHIFVTVPLTCKLLCHGKCNAQFFSSTLC